MNLCAQLYSIGLKFWNSSVLEVLKAGHMKAVSLVLSARKSYFLVKKNEVDLL